MLSWGSAWRSSSPTHKLSVFATRSDSTPPAQTAEALVAQDVATVAARSEGLLKLTAGARLPPVRACLMAAFACLPIVSATNTFDNADFESAPDIAVDTASYGVSFENRDQSGRRRLQSGPAIVLSGLFKGTWIATGIPAIAYHADPSSHLWIFTVLDNTRKFVGFTVDPASATDPADPTTVVPVHVDGRYYESNSPAVDSDASALSAWQTAPRTGVADGNYGIVGLTVRVPPPYTHPAELSVTASAPHTFADMPPFTEPWPRGAVLAQFVGS